jgi:sulfite exporter TauE/SafE
METARIRAREPPAAPPETTSPMTFRQNAPSVAMSEVQYARLKEQIETIPTGAATSIWLTLACTCVGIAATILIGGVTGNLGAALRGKLEVTAWASFAVSAIFLAVHLVHYREARARSRTIITELDTYILRRGSPAQEAESLSVQGAEDSKPTGGDGVALHRRRAGS